MLSRRILFLVIMATLSAVLYLGHGYVMGADNKQSPKVQLGLMLFFDANLSVPAGQSCGSCHSPAATFSDPNKLSPVSIGAIKDRVGNRNTPTMLYSKFSPPFHYDEARKEYVGGQFWDGRAANLTEQAKGPFLNPLEMDNPSAASIVARVRKASYAPLFKQVYGRNSLNNSAKAFDMIADAIAAYEESDALGERFTSKYDFYLKGKVKLTPEEESGLKLFSDPKKANCVACHSITAGADGTPPLFTDFTYHNIGTPKNPVNPFYKLSPQLNPDGERFQDLGLGGILKKPSEYGKLKVPTLRNIVGTGPFMHNGVFPDLRTVVEFINTRDEGKWAPPEVPENIEKTLTGNLKLTPKEISEIIAFLGTLSDGYTPPAQ